MKEILDPSIKGTKGLLESVKAYAPKVERVVITSSSAAILNPSSHAKVYDETIWGTTTWEEALDPIKAYRAGKVSRFSAVFSLDETNEATLTERGASHRENLSHRSYIPERFGSNGKLDLRRACGMGICSWKRRSVAPHLRPSDHPTSPSIRSAATSSFFPCSPEHLQPPHSRYTSPFLS